MGYRPDVSERSYSVSERSHHVSVRPTLKELTYTNIDTNKKQFSNKSSEVGAIVTSNIGNKEFMINELSKLPLPILETDLNNKYYCKLAIIRKEELAREKDAVYVSPQKIISALNNVKKQSNVRYRQKVEYNKRNGIKPWEK